MRFEISFSGHENVLATHKRTIEITKDASLTPRGDCIIGVGASHACADIPDAIKERLRDPGRAVLISIEAEGHRFETSGRGHENLTLAHKGDIVIRKSRFTCPRTLAVGCGKASDDIPGEMRRALQSPDTRGILSIEV